MIEFTLSTSTGSAHSRTVEIPTAGTYHLDLLHGHGVITVVLESEAEFAAKLAPLRAALDGDAR